MPAINMVGKVVTFFMVRIERSYQFRTRCHVAFLSYGELLIVSGGLERIVRQFQRCESARSGGDYIAFCR